MPIFLILACANAPDPDGSWGISVTGLETNCTQQAEGFREDYVYDLFYQGSFVEIRIEDEIFATGRRSGCFLEYQSSIYLEKDPAGNFNWQISGVTEYQSSAGGCTQLPDKADWYGTEVVTVVSSDNDSVEEGCTYEMQTVGSFGQEESMCCQICPEGQTACGDVCILDGESCSSSSGCACNYY